LQEANERTKEAILMSPDFVAFKSLLLDHM